MLRVRREGRVVMIRATVTCDTDRHFDFTFDTGNEWIAALLATELRTQFQDRVRSVREISYNEGWADKASKRKKASWFRDWI